MPFFRPRDKAQTGQPQEAPSQNLPNNVDDPAEAQRALENGQLVPAALRRLSALSDQDSFTSDLSINEFSLVKSSGLHPICQVAGTAVYKIGYQQIPYGGSQPLTVISEAFNEARRLALSRIEQEATLAHADAVVGVRITQGMFDAESGLIEFSLIGTAVKSLNGLLGRSQEKAKNRPVLTTLSGQDVHLLLENGISPAGLVGASCCYLATLSASTYQQMYSMFGSGMVNFEIREFTQGYYASRRIVMQDVEKAAKSIRARGIIDFRFHSSTNSYQMPGSNSENVGAVSFITHVLATAIYEPAQTSQPKPQKILFVSP